MNGKLFSWLTFASGLLACAFMLVRGEVIFEKVPELIITFGVLSATIAGIVVLLYVKLHTKHYEPAYKLKWILGIPLTLFFYVAVGYIILNGHYIAGFTCLLAFWGTRILVKIISNLPRKLKNPEREKYLGIPAMTLGFMLFYLLMTEIRPAGQDITPSELFLTYFPNLYSMVDLGFVAVTVSFGIALGIFRELGVKSHKPERFPIWPIDEKLNLKNLIPLIRIEHPGAAAAVMDHLKDSPDSELIPILGKLQEQFPRVWYKMSATQQKTIQYIDSQITSFTQNIKKGNPSKEVNPWRAWCTCCYCRPEVVSASEIQVLICPKCKKEDRIQQGVRRVIGVVTGGTKGPEETGEWFLNAWNPTLKRFIPGAYDEIVLSENASVNFDWFIAAMVDWAERTRSQRQHPLKVRILGKLRLSVNSMRLINAASKQRNIRLLKK